MNEEDELLSFSSSSLIKNELNDKLSNSNMNKDEILIHDNDTNSNNLLDLFDTKVMIHENQSETSIKDTFFEDFSNATSEKITHETQSKGKSTIDDTDSFENPLTQVSDSNEHTAISQIPHEKDANMDLISFDNSEVKQDHDLNMALSIDTQPKEDQPIGAHHEDVSKSIPQQQVKAIHRDTPKSPPSQNIPPPPSYSMAMKLSQSHQNNVVSKPDNPPTDTRESDIPIPEMKSDFPVHHHEIDETISSETQNHVNHSDLTTSSGITRPALRIQPDIPFTDDADLLEELDMPSSEEEDLELILPMPPANAPSHRAKRPDTPENTSHISQPDSTENTEPDNEEEVHHHHEEHKSDDEMDDQSDKHTEKTEEELNTSVPTSPKLDLGGDGGGDDGGEPQPPPKDVTLQMWLELLFDRFEGKASLNMEPQFTRRNISSKSPLTHVCNIGTSYPALEQLANPVFDESMKSDARLRQMRRRAENAAVMTEKRQKLVLESQHSKEFAVGVARALVSIREQGTLPKTEESIESQDALYHEIAFSIDKLKSWDPFFEAHGFDDAKHFTGDGCPTSDADINFGKVILKQSQLVSNKSRVNGELIRQYLNVVLRGLPASPALTTMVRGIPAQDVSLSFSASPDCKYALGRVCTNFRRVFCAVYESLFACSDPSEATKMLKVAVKDLTQFMTILTRCVLWRYPEIFARQVRDVFGDPSHGRIQDSRRGGEIPKTTENVMLVVRTCVEDALIDPLLDNLYLAYGTCYGESDALIAAKCQGWVDSRSTAELMEMCEIPPLFRLEVSHPHRKTPRSRTLPTSPMNEDESSPYSSVITLLTNVWCTARTPCSKLAMLGQAVQMIHDCAFKHYSRPTYWANPQTGATIVHSPITDRNNVLPSSKQLVSIFLYCVIKSTPFNLESHGRLMFDLASRHAVLFSEETRKALAILLMCPKIINDREL